MCICQGSDVQSHAQAWQLEVSAESQKELVMQRCGLEIINIMNNDASLNAAAGAYQGLDRFKARKRLWADMKVRSLLGRASCKASLSLQRRKLTVPCRSGRSLWTPHLAARLATATEKPSC